MPEFPADSLSVCDLTESAMSSLAEVAARLETRGMDDLSEIELRTLIWARCSLAALYGIRVDALMDAVTLADIGGALSG